MVMNSLDLGLTFDMVYFTVLVAGLHLMEFLKALTVSRRAAVSLGDKFSRLRRYQINVWVSVTT